jgi:hypothetical protein
VELSGNFDRWSQELNWPEMPAEIIYTPEPGTTGVVEFAYDFKIHNEE